MIKVIKEAAREKFHSFRQYAFFFKTYPRNFEMRIQFYINNLQKWLRPIGYKIILKKINETEG